MAVLSTKEADIRLMVAAEVHLGTKNCDFQMERYVFKRRRDGIYIINLKETWEKLQMAARVIVGIENPQDIIVQSARPYGQRAVLKFAQYTGCNAIAGRHTPGTFTNQLQTSFTEPRLLILTDPRTDHQPIKEAALGNIPTIAFCDTDSPMRYVDIGIPANNKGKNSIGVLFWLLGRMVLQMRGVIPQGHIWDDVMVDIFLYREVEESREDELAVADYNDYGAGEIEDWSAQWANEVATSGAPVVSGKLAVADYKDYGAGEIEDGSAQWANEVATSGAPSGGKLAVADFKDYGAGGKFEIQDCSAQWANEVATSGAPVVVPASGGKLEIQDLLASITHDQWVATSELVSLKLKAPVAPAWDIVDAPRPEDSMLLLHAGNEVKTF